MINGFYTAKSGMKGFQTSLNVTANNIANVNTQGFKAKTTAFSELIATSGGDGISVGNGSRVSAINTDDSQGAYRQTGGNLDVMISGLGYFAVENADGSVSYTRSGSFSVSNEADGNYLVTASGEYVLGNGNARIKVTGALSENSLSEVAVYRFDNPGGLVSEGGGKLRASANSGEAVIDTESKLSYRAEELSNVDLISEMTRMITAERGFQYNAKMLQTADELEQTVNNLRS
jgi:flagellar basal-body rod protein FlgG